MNKERPLRGEPLALDLVNTQWQEQEQVYDALSEPAGLQSWLREHNFSAPEALELFRLNLLEARVALRGVLERPADREPLNLILHKGRLLEHLSETGPERMLEVPELWRVSWLAAQNYLDLLREAPQRVRKCGNADCILYFFDTSKNGKRRWCAMESCGNRAKAQRFYRRHSG